jgi:hypothetical protein
MPHSAEGRVRRVVASRLGVNVAAAAFVVAAGAGAACGGGSQTGSPGDAGTDVSVSTGKEAGSLNPDTGSLVGAKSVASLAIAPMAPSLACASGAHASQAFTVTVTYNDGTHTSSPSGVTWSADQPQIGSIDGAGTFTAAGTLGGVVHVTAAVAGISSTTTLTVVLSLQQNPAMAPAATQAALTGATTPDATVVWAYPYDGTVWARGLLAPILQWNGGAPTDTYLVHLKSATFDLQVYTTAPAAPSAQVPLDPTAWQQLTDSSAGAASLTVSRWDGTTATVVAKQTWTLASGSMRGTIYYWSNDLGRVLRIKPGATTADDFANQAPLTDPAQYQQTSCLMTCHTVSADGSTLVSGGGIYAGTYDLKAGKPTYSLGGTWGVNPNGAGQAQWTNVQWEVPALSPDGKYVLTNSMAQSGVTSLGGPDTVMGLFTTADGQPVANSGVAGSPFAAPAWSPEGSRVAFVDSADPTTWTGAGNNWQNPPAGALKAIQFDATKNPMFSGEVSLVPVGTGNAITWPTVSPDGNWVVYARAASFDTRNGNGDLYLASAVTPNQEVRLARLNGDGYPFAAGMRDLSWNYEPSFAPVAAGGYFWVVFTSRRTYGNVLTGGSTTVKQLWVAAIDQNPTPGVDPSHPPFHLTGQVETNLAMRGFFSLPPCAGDGSSCASGTDCCGGYCAPGTSTSSEAGAPEGGAATGGGVCRSTSAGCSSNGDKCVATADCCGASQGVTCINKVCSEAPPR